MRYGLTFVTGASLVLAACSGADQADSTANADTGLTADKIASNDVTAIDAVTGEAANMAADVDFTNLADSRSAADGNAGNTSNTSSSRTAAPTRPSPADEPAARPAPAPAPEPAQPANSTE
ncbi:MAG: hypothetical protein ACREBM_06325 [Sphingomicrobium sp.]